MKKNKRVHIKSWYILVLKTCALFFITSVSKFLKKITITVTAVKEFFCDQLSISLNIKKNIIHKNIKVASFIGMFNEHAEADSLK